MSETRPAPFIVGASRSGTTLLRLMLDAHPEMAIPPETHFLPDLVRACRKSPDPRTAFVEALAAEPMVDDLQLAGQDLDACAAAADPFHLATSVRAIYATYAGRQGKARWGDKTPTYRGHLGLIHGLLPEARFVQLVRDGRDVARSVVPQWFGPQSVDAAAQWWVDCVVGVRRQASALPDNSYLELRYEDLVAAPEETLRKVSRFLDLDWSPDMLEYHTRAEERLSELGPLTYKGHDTVTPSAERRSIHRHTARPPDVSLIGQWRSGLSTADVEAFEQIAGPLLVELGYELATPAADHRGQ
jgi:hypothetical protein